MRLVEEVLDDPGEIDITAHVNFDDLENAASDAGWERGVIRPSGGVPDPSRGPLVPASGGGPGRAALAAGVGGAVGREEVAAALGHGVGPESVGTGEGAGVAGVPATCNATARRGVEEMMNVRFLGLLGVAVLAAAAAGPAWARQTFSAPRTVAEVARRRGLPDHLRGTAQGVPGARDRRRAIRVRRPALGAVGPGAGDDDPDLSSRLRRAPGGLPERVRQHEGGPCPRAAASRPARASGSPSTATVSSGRSSSGSGTGSRASATTWWSSSSSLMVSAGSGSGTRWATGVPPSTTRRAGAPSRRGLETPSSSMSQIMRPEFRCGDQDILRALDMAEYWLKDTPHQIRRWTTRSRPPPGTRSRPPHVSCSSPPCCRREPRRSTSR